MRSRLRKAASCECGSKTAVVLTVRAKNKTPVGHQQYSNRLLKVASIIASICCSSPSLANESLLTAETEPAKNLVPQATAENTPKPDVSPISLSRGKNRRTLRLVRLGVFPSRAEVEDVAARLRQLEFQTQILQVKNGYEVSAGAFSSKTNLERAIRRLNEAGLGDKARVVEVNGKLSQAAAPIETRNTRSPLSRKMTSDGHKKDAEDEYVPKKDYEKLKREVEILKAQMHSLVTKGVQPEQGAQAAAATTPQAETESSEIPDPEDSPQAEADPPADEVPQTQDSLGIAEGSRQLEADESRRELDTFLRGQKVLFKRGELQVEFGLAYSKDTAQTNLGFIPETTSETSTQVETTSVTSTRVAPKVITRSADMSVLARYGLFDDLEFDLTIPYGYIEQEQNFSPFDVPEPLRRSDSVGIGDISLGLRYTAWPESGNIPNITLNLNAKSKTGNDNNDVTNTANQSTGLGTGFWNVGARISLVKTIDPVVFFGSIGYTATLKEGGRDPGDQIPYSFGTGFSMNDRVSFSTSLSGSVVRRTEVNGRGIAGSSANINSLQLSSTIQLTKRLFVEPFVGFGLNDEATDFIVGFNVPYRFERLFPLPFFHE